MYRRRLLALAGSTAAVAVAGCLGDDDGADDEAEESQPETGEFSAVQEFTSQAIFGLEFTQLLFAALVDEEATRDDVETAQDDLETALELREEVPPTAEMEPWSFTLEADGEEYDVEGSDVVAVVEDLTGVTEAALATVEDVLAVYDDGGVSETLAEDMADTIEDIEDVVPRARSVIFND